MDAEKTINAMDKTYRVLTEKISAISDYWTMMDAILEDIHSHSDKLRTDDASKITAMMLATNLKAIGVECGTYKLQVST